MHLPDLSVGRTKNNKNVTNSVVFTEEEIAMALQASNGFLSDAAERLGMSAGQISNRIKSSDYLQDVLHFVREKIIDTATSQLVTLIQAGHFPAIKFLLERLGKERGFGNVEEKHVKHSGGIVLLPAKVDSSEEWERQTRAKIEHRRKLLEDQVVDVSPEEWL